MAEKYIVLFMARRYPPSVGGMERFAFDLSSAIEKKIKLTKITWGGSNTWLPIIIPLHTIRGAFALGANRNIKIIHMQDAVLAPVGWLLSQIFRKPYIVVAHGLDITYNNFFYQYLILPFVRKADAVISISTATKEEVDARGVNPKKSFVVTLGTHDDYGAPKPNRQLLSEKIGMDLKSRKPLLTTGRLVKRKGVEWFIRNPLPEICKKDKTVLYLVAGDGAERDAIEKAIADNKLEGNVKMLGRVSDEVRSLLYQSCDIFVMPNIIVPGDMEGFGLVAQEAATAELPVVASGIEGIRDALQNGKNGILVQTKDTKAFQKEILALIADKEKRVRFGKKARRFTLENYSWNKIADKYIGIYKKLG